MGLLSLGLTVIASPLVGQETPSGGIIFPEPVSLQLDVHPSVGASNLNGVFEPGEGVVVEPSWSNGWFNYFTLGAVASLFTGPAGATYGVWDSAATYQLPPFGVSSCFDYQGDCYQLAVDAPSPRPAAHWDATFRETLVNVPSFMDWTLHIGESFPDVPTSNLFYASIENIFHHGVTGGCGNADYCPSSFVSRAQMAVLVLKAKNGSSYAPPPCTGTVFLDVACAGGIFDPWIEDLAGQGLVDGCGGGNYCPTDPASRRQVAVSLLKTRYGSGYAPPPAVGIFGDVPPDDADAAWIEDLYNRGITAGCQAAPLLYCPGNPDLRGQMAVLLVKTFGLVLY